MSSSPVSDHSATTIHARGLTRRFGAHTAVKTIDLELKRGEVLGFLGPNGAGKTTTMQMLTGNLAPTAGEITICGVDLLARPTAAKARIGYLPETPPLYRDLTVDEYLRLAVKLHRVSKPHRSDAIRRAKERCGLVEVGRKLIGTLSKGYQQRVGIAQAIAHEPDAVILDEPTVGLDLPAELEFYGLLRRLQHERAITVVCVSHDLLALAGQASELVCINRRMHVHGNPEEVVHSHALREAYSCEFDFLAGEIAHHQHHGASH